MKTIQLKTQLLALATVAVSTDLYAQATDAANPQLSPLANLAPFVLIFIVFYFLLIRPQKKKMQEEQMMLNQLTKGQEIYTKAGMIGTITGLTEKIVTLEIAEGVKVKVLRGQIGGTTKKLFEAPKGKAAVKAPLSSSKSSKS